MPVALRAWETVLRHIERELLDGRLRPGDHLAPERTLAAELGVGRSSVREAVRVLEGFGLIRTQTGSGPSAGAIIVATPHGGMSALMRLQVAAQGFAVADIVKTRLLLETQIAAGLADAAPPASLAASHTLLDAMDEPALSAAEFLALDAQFHVSLAEASGNQVVTAMMAGLRDSVESYALAGLPALPDWQATLSRLRSEHRGIVAAIEARDAVAAYSRIHAHIDAYYAETHSAVLANAGIPAAPAATATATVAAVAAATSAPKQTLPLQTPASDPSLAGASIHPRNEKSHG